MRNPTPVRIGHATYEAVDSSPDLSEFMVAMGAILDASATLQSVAESQAPRVVPTARPREVVLSVFSSPWTAATLDGAVPLAGAGWSVAYLGRPRPPTAGDDRARVFFLGSPAPYWPEMAIDPRFHRMSVPPGRRLTTRVGGALYSDIRHADVLSLTGGSGTSVAPPVCTRVWETRGRRGSRLHVLYLRDPDDGRRGGGNLGHAWSDDAGRSWSRVRVSVGDAGHAVPPVRLSHAGRAVEVFDPATGGHRIERLPQPAAAIGNTQVVASYFVLERGTPRRSPSAGPDTSARTASTRGPARTPSPPSRRGRCPACRPVSSARAGSSCT